MDTDQKKKILPIQPSPDSKFRELYERIRVETHMESLQESFVNDELRPLSEDDMSNPEHEVAFIASARGGHLNFVEDYILAGINVNVRDKFGMTALHYGAAMGIRPFIRLLVNSGRCDYLIKDNKGRLASELAYEWGGDYAVGLLLQKKEAKQAYEQSLSPAPGVSGDDG